MIIIIWDQLPRVLTLNFDQKPSYGSRLLQRRVPFSIPEAIRGRNPISIAFIGWLLPVRSTMSFSFLIILYHILLLMVVVGLGWVGLGINRGFHLIL